jgi:hypothetical protein
MTKQKKTARPKDLNESIAISRSTPYNKNIDDVDYRRVGRIVLKELD